MLILRSFFFVLIIYNAFLQLGLYQVPSSGQF